MVLAHCQRKSIYLEALLAFQPVSEPPAFVLGLRGNTLTGRFNRLISAKKLRRPDVWEVSLLLAGFVIFSAFGYISRVKMETVLPVPKTIYTDQPENRPAKSSTLEVPGCRSHRKKTRESLRAIIRCYPAFDQNHTRYSTQNQCRHAGPNREHSVYR